MRKGGRQKMKWKGQKEEVIASIFLIWSSVLLFLFWTDRIFNLRNKKNTAQKMLPSTVINLDKSLRFIEIMASITI